MFLVPSFLFLICVKQGVTDEELAQIATNFSPKDITDIAGNYLKIIAKERTTEIQRAPGLITFLKIGFVSTKATMSDR